MRTTIRIDDELLARAEALSNASNRTELIELALKALIRQAAQERLRRAGGTLPDLEVPERRRGTS